jgi:hypothetical protein
MPEDVVYRPTIQREILQPTVYTYQNDDAETTSGEQEIDPGLDLGQLNVEAR